MPSHAAIRGDEVFPIPVAVMQPGTLAPVNLYIRIQGSAKFALYKKASSRLQEDTRQGLMSHRVDALYLRKTDEGAFHEYVENNIGAVIRDEFLSPPAKACEILYETSAHVTKEVFDDPRSGRNM